MPNLNASTSPMKIAMPSTTLRANGASCGVMKNAMTPKIKNMQHSTSKSKSCVFNLHSSEMVFSMTLRVSV